MSRNYQHQKVQREGKKADGNICQFCGSPQNQEGHHIIEFQHGGQADVNNIISLCHVCHKQLHRGSINIIRI